MDSDDVSRSRRVGLRESGGHTFAGTDHERGSDYNQRVTLQAIRVHGEITRVELARITGLTPPSIANIANRLLQQGLILETGRLHGRRGQPAKRLAINPDGCYSIGVNIDRDHVTVLALDILGEIRARVIDERNFALPDTVVSFVRKALDAIRREVPLERVIGTGVALPDDLGRIPLPRRPASYSVWNSVDVRKMFGDAVPGPIVVENDATAAAVGELQLGHGLRSSSFFYILVNAALGGGLVLEGSYFRGADGRSAELGFLPLRSRRTTARSLQEAVSLSALYERFAALGFELSRPERLESLNAKEQKVLDQWIEDSADFLVDPVIAISCLVNPNAVFIGGRLPALCVDRLAEQLNARLRRRGGVPVIAPVLRAAMCVDAPAIGAAILPFSEQLLPSRQAMLKEIR